MYKDLKTTYKYKKGKKLKSFSISIGVGKTPNKLNLEVTVAVFVKNKIAYYIESLSSYNAFLFSPINSVSLYQRFLMGYFFFFLIECGFFFYVKSKSCGGWWVGSMLSGW